MKKISKAKIATTYANALYQAALETKAVARVFDDVKSFGQLLAEDASLIKFMANPMLSQDDKKDVLKQVAQRLKWDVDTLRCMEIIAENRRFKELPQILQEFAHVYYQNNGMVEVEVASVKALSAAQEAKLQEKLEKLLNKKIILSYKITPELIGGLRIKYGSELIDDSISSKLKRLENVMKGVQ